MNKLKVFLLMALVMFFSSYAIAESADSISTGKLLRYAKRLRYGINTDVDMQRAANVYGYLAKKGNVVAQRELGRMFLRGEGVQRNSKAARLWLHKACLANDAKAMCIMADIYQHGLGVKTNKSLAFKLYLQAARMGNSQGCFGAGSMLYKGQGVKQDYQKAKVFLQKGSEMGNAKCDFLLANCYAYGYCGTPDYSKAKEFLNRAVQNGHGWTVDMTLFNKLDSVMAQNDVAPKPVLAIAKDKSIRIPVEHAADVVGFWKGTMAVYDWGKTRVLSKEPIMLEVTQDTSLVVTCFQNDSIVSVFRADRQIDNLWKKEHIGRADKIYKWIPLSVLFEKSADTYTLYAHLNRLSINTSNPKYKKCYRI